MLYVYYILVPITEMIYLSNQPLFVVHVVNIELDKNTLFVGDKAMYVTTIDDGTYSRANA